MPVLVQTFIPDAWAEGSYPLRVVALTEDAETAAAAVGGGVVAAACAVAVVESAAVGDVAAVETAAADAAAEEGIDSAAGHTDVADDAVVVVDIADPETPADTGMHRTAEDEQPCRKASDKDSLACGPASAEECEKEEAVEAVSADCSAQGYGALRIWAGLAAGA